MEKLIEQKEIGKRIKTYRMQKTLGQTELAERLGISQTHMSNIEHGKVGMTVEVLVKLAKIFEVSLDELVLGKKPKTENAAAGKGFKLDDYRLSDLVKALELLKQVQ